MDTGKGVIVPGDKREAEQSFEQLTDALAEKGKDESTTIRDALSKLVRYAQAIGAGKGKNHRSMVAFVETYRDHRIEVLRAKRGWRYTAAGPHVYRSGTLKHVKWQIDQGPVWCGAPGGRR